MRSMMEYNYVNMRRMLPYFCVVLFILSSMTEPSSGLSKSKLEKLQEKSRVCCRFNLGQKTFNTSECKNLEAIFQTELGRMKMTSTRSYKYAKRLWKSLSLLTREVEDLNDEAVYAWNITVSKAEEMADETVVFWRVRQMNPEKEGPAPNPTKNLTRLEFVLPFYYIHNPSNCPANSNKSEDLYISVNGKNIFSEKMSNLHQNLQVFRLPPSLLDDKTVVHNSSSINIKVKGNKEHVAIHLKGAMFLEYYNINETILTKMESITRKRNLKFQRRYLSNRMKKISPDFRGRNTREVRSFKSIVKAKTLESDNQFCKLHKYRVNLHEHLNMRMVLEPRVINIGRCAGKCNALKLQHSDDYSTAHSILLNLLTKAPGDQSLVHSRCVPDKLSPVTIMRTDYENTWTIAIYTYRGAKINSCRCV